MKKIKIKPMDRVVLDAESIKKIAVIETNVGHIKDRMDEVVESSKNFVTSEVCLLREGTFDTRLSRIEKIVYGIVAALGLELLALAFSIIKAKLVKI